MATFTLNKVGGNSTQTTLQTVDLSADTSTSTLSYQAGAVLYLQNNGEAGDIIVNLLGDDQTSFVCPGYGSVDVSAGFDVTVADGEIVAVNLLSIAKYLGAQGNNVTVTTTGATGSSFGWLVG